MTEHVMTALNRFAWAWRCNGSCGARSARARQSRQRREFPLTRQGPGSARR
jgi:hypothetical protein